MTKNKVIAISLVLLALVASVSVAFAQTVAPVPEAQSDDPQGPKFPWGPRGNLGDIDKEALLAEALGISVEELQSAQDTAQDTALERALEAGLISQEQYDRLQLWGGFGRMGRHGHFGKGNPSILAETLGISVEELQSAQEAAKAAGIEQALDDGLITQEQAEMMEAHSALKAYLDKEAMFAEALGITVEDLQEASAAGTPIPELIEELGLTPEEVRAGMETARETAIQEAVADGLITQELADEILEHEGRGFGGRGFGRGHGRRGSGRGLFQNRPESPEGTQFGPSFPGLGDA